MPVKPIIISASRRTDIPAYYADWFRRRLETGFTVYPNPISGKPVFQRLDPASVLAFVFWTRNPFPLFKHLDYIDENYGRRHYMHLTINGLPEIFEPRNPKIGYATGLALQLAERYGPGYVQWRFDPVVISSATPEEYIYEKFNDIAARLNGVVRRCYFSFVDLYEKTKKNFRKISLKTGITFQKQSLEDQIRITNNLADIAGKYQITMHACVEDQLLNCGIEKAHCIDRDLIAHITPESYASLKLQPSRLGCGCFDSRDIGYYDSCPHGCIYCYSNRDPDRAFANAKQFLKNGFPLDELPLIQITDEK
jgi:hypothetical protein